MGSKLIFLEGLFVLTCFDVCFCILFFEIESICVALELALHRPGLECWPGTHVIQISLLLTPSAGIKAMPHHAQLVFFLRQGLIACLASNLYVVYASLKI